MVGDPGLEPGTSVLSGLRSNQLSYWPVRGVSAGKLSGLRHHRVYLWSRNGVKAMYNTMNVALVVSQLCFYKPVILRSGATKNLGWGRLALGSAREVPPPQVLRGVYPERSRRAQNDRIVSRLNGRDTGRMIEKG